MTYHTKSKIQKAIAILISIVLTIAFIWVLLFHNPFVDEDGFINPMLFPEAAQAQAIQEMARGNR